MEQLSHSSLIKLHYSEHEEGSFNFYYEYVHLTLEKWIINLGDDVLGSLKSQMLDLSNFLNASGIAFTFDPRFVGVNQDMRLKYFISDFSIIDAGQEQLRARNEAAIKRPSSPSLGSRWLMSGRSLSVTRPSAVAGIPASATTGRRHTSG